MWMINQFNEDLNDAFELHFPSMLPLQRWLYGRLTSMALWGLTNRVRLFGATTVVTERIVEYSTVFTWLPDRPARVLDIGCVSSRLPIQLASLGYEVHGLDTRPYRWSHRNLTFHQQDLFTWSANLRFDTVYLISVLEHIGLGGYGTVRCENADHHAIQRIIGLMRPGGQLVVSVPFGKRGQTPKHRVYDMNQLKDLFADFIWRRLAYFKRIEQDWLPSLPEDLAEVISPPGLVNGVAVLGLILRG